MFSSVAVKELIPIKLSSSVSLTRSRGIDMSAHNHVQRTFKEKSYDQMKPIQVTESL